MSVKLEIYTVYEHPKDFPNDFVLRRIFLLDDGSLEMEKEAVTAPSLDEIRKAIPPGRVRVLRRPDDDPVIVECWI